MVAVFYLYNTKCKKKKIKLFFRFDKLNFISEIEYQNGKIPIQTILLCQRDRPIFADNNKKKKTDIAIVNPTAVCFIRKVCGRQDDCFVLK